MGKLGGAALLIALVVVFSLIVLITGGGQSSCASTGAVSASAAAAREPVGGYSGDQLANAAAIMNAGASMGINAHGLTIGVMTAIGESGLQNLDHGDVAGPDSRGLFQQRDTWGTLEQRMDPSESAKLFFERLVKVPNWDTMDPSAAAHAVQINTDPNHYTPFYAPAEAIVAALVTGDAACAAASASGNSQQLAQALVVKIDAGTITGLSPDHLREIRWIAAGETHVNCGIDLRILQVITIAANTFDTLGISDINDLCTNQYLGNPDSSHWANGGGHAVDFYAFDRTPTTGADANAVKLLRVLGAVLPAGSAVGQVECRAAAGTSVDLPGIGQFDDFCNHLHVQVDPTTDTPMKLSQ